MAAHGPCAGPAAELQKIVAKIGQMTGLTTRESNPEGYEAELVV